MTNPLTTALPLSGPHEEAETLDCPCNGERDEDCEICQGRGWLYADEPRCDHAAWTDARADFIQ